MIFESNIIRLQEIPSTNTYLRELSDKDDLPEGTVVVAENQFAGRGQKGNVWESEAGKNISFSMILYPEFISVRDQFIISQCIALAIRDTLSEYVDNIKIKWPNDIYHEKKKICGMLIENSIENNLLKKSIIGPGININQQVFSGLHRVTPTSLYLITGKEQDTEHIFEKAILNIHTYYQSLKDGNIEQITDAYKRDLFSTGTFKDGDEIFNAQITDVASNGVLILTDSKGVRRHYNFKEVEYVL